MSYSFSEDADNDITQILTDGVLKFGEKQAGLYKDQLFERLEFLSANPYASRLETLIHPPLRVSPFKSHVILYNVTPQDDIYILRIRHAGEDWL